MACDACDAFLASPRSAKDAIKVDHENCGGDWMEGFYLAITGSNFHNMKIRPRCEAKARQEGSVRALGVHVFAWDAIEVSQQISSR